MKALAKSSRVLIDGLLADVRSHASSVTAAEEALREALDDLFTPLNDAIAAYNESVTSLNEAIDEEIGQIDEYVEARSERWQEGEAAQRYAAWREALEGAKLEEADEPDRPEVDYSDLAAPEDSPPYSLDEVDG